MSYIAILLTVHNRKLQTLKCLQQLVNQQQVEDYKCDIYITDDGCTDGTPQAVQELYPTINIIKGNGSLFWNRGMYKAWQAAINVKDYDFYLWLNDDTQLEDNALSVLLQTSRDLLDKCIIVGTTTAINNTNIITYGGRNINGELIQPLNKPLKCYYFNGNIVLLPEYVYARVGMNDPLFHHALGDFDYGLRARKLGIESYISSGVIGKCNEHTKLPVWCNPLTPFVKRWEAFRTPLGHNPEEFFIYEKRHNGLYRAIFHYITNHLRLLFPKMWLRRSLL